MVKNQYIKTSTQKIETEFNKNLQELTNKFEKQKIDKEKTLKLFLQDFQHYKELRKEEI